MKLSIGMRVVDTRNAELRRWQVVDFDSVAVRVRPLVFRDGKYTTPETMVTAGEVIPPPVGWLRVDFDRCFRRDDES